MSSVFWITRPAAVFEIAIGATLPRPLCTRPRLPAPLPVTCAEPPEILARSAMFRLVVVTLRDLQSVLDADD